MEIVLVRHGEPEWVRDGLNVDDPPLTGRGVRQAEAMAGVLGREHIDEVLCSPLVRARQTAAPLLAALGRAETVAPWLEEIRNPIWHGTPVEKAEQAFAEQRSRPAKDRWRGLEDLGGEHVGSFVARIREGCGLFLAERGIEPVDDGEFALWTMPEESDRPHRPEGSAGPEESARSQPSKRIVLVAHAGTNAAIVCHLLGLAPVPWEWDRFILNHASITRLTTLGMGDGHAFALSRLSDVEHLTADDRTV